MTERHPRRPVIFLILLTACLVLPAGPAIAQQAAASAPRAAEPRVSTPSPTPPGEVERLRAKVFAMSEENRAESRLFHVALVLAERGPAGDGDGHLPAAVQKALDDIRDFLPYDRYRVVDSALVRSAGNGEATLRGPNGTPHRATFLFTETEVDGRTMLDVRHFVLHRDTREMPRPEERRGGAAIAPRAPERPLSATFRMGVDETVVVGSSSLEGGPGGGSSGQRALIVLLTAVP